MKNNCVKSYEPSFFSVRSAGNPFQILEVLFTDAWMLRCVLSPADGGSRRTLRATSETVIILLVTMGISSLNL
jgi:hypothetical protein